MAGKVVPMTAVGATPAMQQMTVVVPAGVGPGLKFQVAVAGAGNMEVVCPAGAAPGSQITISVPAPTAVPVVAVAAPAGAPVGAVPGAAPTGLAILRDAAGFYIRQRAQWFEEFTGFEKANKYDVMLKPKGVTGLQEEQIRQLPQAFFALEKSECFERQFCKPNHTFSIEVHDTTRNTIMILEHPNSCCDWTGECFCCGCKCNPTTMHIKTPQGQIIGRAEKSYRTFKCTKDQWVDVFDHNGNHAFTFESACCQCGPNMCCTEYVLHIHKGADTSTPPIGVLKNVWPGCNAKGLFSKADNLELEWFQDITVDEKALLFGTAFLIDFMLFEKEDEGGGGGG